MRFLQGYIFHATNIGAAAPLHQHQHGRAQCQLQRFHCQSKLREIFGLPFVFCFVNFFAILFYFLLRQPGSRSGPESSANPSSGLPPMVASLPPPIANMASALPPMASNLPPMASTIPPGSSAMPLMPAMTNVLAPASSFPHPLTPTLSPSPSPLNVSFYFSFVFSSLTSRLVQKNMVLISANFCSTGSAMGRQCWR